MPATFTAPIAQPAMAKATILNVALDPEAQTAVVAYQPEDSNGNAIGNATRLSLTFAQLSLTKAQVYNAVLTAVGLTGTIT